MEYKVLTKEDRRWSGKFSPENLEHTLNSYAAEGWRVVSSVPVASMWSISTSQIMILLERETRASCPGSSSPRRAHCHYTSHCPYRIVDSGALETAPQRTGSGR